MQGLSLLYGAVGAIDSTVCRRDFPHPVGAVEPAWTVLKHKFLAPEAATTAQASPPQSTQS